MHDLSKVGNDLTFCQTIRQKLQSSLPDRAIEVEHYTLQGAVHGLFKGSEVLCFTPFYPDRGEPYTLMHVI